MYNIIILLCSILQKMRFSKPNNCANNEVLVSCQLALNLRAKTDNGEHNMEQNNRGESFVAAIDRTSTKNTFDVTNANPDLGSDLQSS